MYTLEQLTKYPYFAERIKDTAPEALTDYLTGVVSRGHILWFAQWLIEHEIPFSFAMLDLDNFKFINDTYGHHIGDQVLVKVADDLAAMLDGIGLVGRFGGDEFLIVNLRDVTYEANKAFFREIYSGKILRRNIQLEDCSPFITGTVGCAIYPKDAQTFDELFELIDKTLYRGKNKGRNCYILYVAEKHKDIVIRRIARRGMNDHTRRLVDNDNIRVLIDDIKRNILGGDLVGDYLFFCEDDGISDARKLVLLIGLLFFATRDYLNASLIYRADCGVS